jgi:hypothetical protein
MGCFPEDEIPAAQDRIRTTTRTEEAGRDADFVIEADEYDRAFLGLNPDVAIVTNVVTPAVSSVRKSVPWRSNSKYLETTPMASEDSEKRQELKGFATV